METKLVQVPFDVEMAKHIQNGDCEGKIVTRGGMKVRVLCFDRIGNESIVALVYEETDNKETCIIYLNDGTIPNCKQTRFDLMLEVPEYLTFKDGDIFKTSDGSIGIYNANYTPMHGITPYYVGLRYSDGVLCFCQGNEFGFGALRECTHDVTESEKQKLIDALKSSEEPLSKEYLKRFFGIEEHSNSSNIGKDYKFKPFDKVLVRDDEGRTWRANLFSNYWNDGKEYKYGCIDSAWMYCIPYEGNEHLLGTTKNPE